jgi:hypothetical protein
MIAKFLSDRLGLVYRSPGRFAAEAQPLSAIERWPISRGVEGVQVKTQLHPVQIEQFKCEGQDNARFLGRNPPTEGTR